MPLRRPGAPLAHPAHPHHAPHPHGGADLGKPESDAYAPRLPEQATGRAPSRPTLPGQRERPVG
jgi:hypothetical protein